MIHEDRAERTAKKTKTAWADPQDSGAREPVTVAVDRDRKPLSRGRAQNERVALHAHLRVLLRELVQRVPKRAIPGRIDGVDAVPESLLDHMERIGAEGPQQAGARVHEQDAARPQVLRCLAEAEHVARPARLCEAEPVCVRLLKPKPETRSVEWVYPTPRAQGAEPGFGFGVIHAGTEEAIQCDSPCSVTGNPVGPQPGGLGNRRPTCWRDANRGWAQHPQPRVGRKRAARNREAFSGLDSPLHERMRPVPVPGDDSHERGPAGDAGKAGPIDTPEKSRPSVHAAECLIRNDAPRLKA